MSYFVYLLCTVGRSQTTYVGATVDLDHRLKQHNGILKGGAVATTTKVKKGELWERIAYIKNFPTWKSALQFEWRWKQISRKLSHTLSPVKRRMHALQTLLSLERPTSKAVAYSEWKEPPEIVFEHDGTNQIYNEISHPEPVIYLDSSNNDSNNDSNNEPIVPVNNEPIVPVHDE